MKLRTTGAVSLLAVLVFSGCQSNSADESNQTTGKRRDRSNARSKEAPSSSRVARTGPRNGGSRVFVPKPGPDSEPRWGIKKGGGAGTRLSPISSTSVTGKTLAKKQAPIPRSESSRKKFEPREDTLQALWDAATTDLATTGGGPSDPVSIKAPVLTNSVQCTSKEGDYTLDTDSINNQEDESNVYGAHITEKEFLVLKYRMNCEEENSVKSEANPLIRNFKFMRMIENSEARGLTPTPKFLSGATVIDDTSDLRGMELITPKACTGAQMRYLTMSMHGITLDQFITLTGGPMRPIEAVNVGISLVRMLKKLHSLKIVHGDISSRNVLMRSPKGLGSPFDDLILVDWDRAHVEGLVGDEFVYAGTPSTLYQTPFERDPVATRTFPSYRDDLYRVFEMMAVLTVGKDYYNDLKTKSEADVNAMKKSNFLLGWSPQIGNDTDYNSAANELHQLVMGGQQGRVVELNKAAMLLSKIRDIIIAKWPSN